MTVEVAHAPEGFELIDHHDPPGWFHPADGVVITVHARDVVDRMFGRYPFRVIMAAEQVGKYDGVFRSQRAAERKARELAEQYADHNG